MASVLPKNIQSVLVTNMTTSSALAAAMISTSNLISNNATIPTIVMTGSLYATHTNNTIANIFTTNGNVGIGTTSPSARLDVSGTARITTSLTTGILYATNAVFTSNSANTFVGTTISTSNVYGTLGTISNLVGTSLSSSNLTVTTATLPNSILNNITSNSIFITNGSLISTFNSNTLGNLFTTFGNVGINITTPSYRLDINGSLRATSGDVTLGNLSVNTLISSANIISSLNTIGTLQSTNINNSLLNASGNSNTIGNIFTTGGNVGIGTAITPERLTVSGNISITNGNLQIANNVYSRPSIRIEQYGSNLLVSSPTTGSTVTILQNTGGGGLSLQADGGNVGIGTTAASVKLQVEDGSVIIGDSPYISTSVPSAPGNLGTPNGYRLFFDNTINQTAGTGMPANKIVLHNNNWTAGFGVEGSSVTYHSGYSHTFYGNANNTSTYGNALMMVRGDGNVGIATTNPQTTLHINGPGLQMGTSTNAFHLFNTQASLYLLTGATGAGTYVATFSSTGNVGIGTTAPLYRLDTPGTIRASTGMLISGNSVLEFGHNIAGKNLDAGKIGYNTWTNGLNIVGAGTSGSNRLVYIYDHLQVDNSITVANLRTTGVINAAGNSTVQATTNNYTLTSGSLNVTGDIVMSGTKLHFTTTGVNPPTMNGRGSGSKIVLYPGQGTTSGDYSLGIEGFNMWLQVPDNNSGYKFYQGTSPNFVIATNGNIGIGTTSPSASLDVRGNIYMPLASRFTTAITDNFNYSGNIVGHYSLGWYTDPSSAGGPMSYLSGYGGIRFFTVGAPRVNILDTGNVGIATTSPAQLLDINGNVALSNASGSKMFLGNSTTGAARLNIRDFSTNLVEFQYSTNTIGNINCLANGTGLLLKGGGTNQLVLSSNGNIGIETTAPQNTLDITGTLRVSNSNTSASSITFRESTTNTTLDIILGNRGGTQLGGWTTLDPNGGTTGNSGIHIWDGLWINATNQYVFNSTGLGIGTTSPAYLLDVNGTIDAITVTTGNMCTGTATIGTLLNTTFINYGINAQWVINGGGTITWTGNNLLWSTRVIIIPAKKTEYGSAGYFDINCPTSGTITYYNGSNVTTTVTCTASGIPMTDWDALYYEITPGQANTSDQTKFRLANYGNSTWRPTSNWILIAVKNADSSSLKWIPGSIYIPSGKIYYSDSTNNWQINGTTNYIPKFNAANTLTANSQIFDNGTNVGIGTAAPNVKLDVRDGSGYFGNFTGVNSGAAALLTFVTGGKLCVSSGVNGLPSTTGTNGNAIAFRIRGGDNATLDFGANSINTWLQASDFTSGYNNNYHIHLNPNGGNVAIGNGGSTPTYKFQVSGAGGFTGNLYVNYGGAGSTPQIQVSPTTNGAESSIGFWQNTNNGGALWVVGHNPGTAGSDKFAIYNGTYGGNTLTIQNNGYIGIGNNSPGYKLEINGTCKVTNELYVGNATGVGTIYMGGGAAGDGAYDHSVIETRNYTSTESTEMLLFKGNDVSGASGPDRIRLRASNIVFDTYSSATTDRNAESIRMTIDQNGNIGVGTASPSYRFHVSGDTYTTGWSRVGNGVYAESSAAYMQTNDAYYGAWKMGGNQQGTWDGIRFPTNEINLLMGSSNNNKQCGFHYNGVGWAMTVDSSRSLYVVGDITAYWSDRRLKTNLQQLSHFDDVLTSLTGYTFNWNKKGQKILQKSANELDIGLIAQDVQAVIPQAVKVNKAGMSLEDDADAFDYLTINYDKIVPFLIEGYKSQRQEIKDLKCKVERLEELVQQLLNR